MTLKTEQKNVQRLESAGGLLVLPVGYGMDVFWYIFSSQKKRVLATNINFDSAFYVSGLINRIPACLAGVPVDAGCAHLRWVGQVTPCDSVW